MRAAPRWAALGAVFVECLFGCEHQRSDGPPGGAGRGGGAGMTDTGGIGGLANAGTGGRAGGAGFATGDGAGNVVGSAGTSAGSGGPVGGSRAGTGGFAGSAGTAGGGGAAGGSRAGSGGTGALVIPGLGNCTPPAGANPPDARAAYAKFKNDIVTSDGAGGFLRVLRPNSLNAVVNSTVSEGIAYGMLLAVYADDQSTFDKFWQYSQIHLDGNGLMHWYIGPSG